MRKFLVAALLISSLASNGQSIATSNISFWYDPNFEGQFRLKIVNADDSVLAYYHIDTTVFSVKWERRATYGQRGGDPIGDIKPAVDGKLSFAAELKPWLLVAVLRDKRINQPKLYFKQIDAKYPADARIVVNKAENFKGFIPVNAEAVFNSDIPNLKVYHYDDNFPAASPPFQEKELKVDPLMIVDSTFTIASGQPVRFKKPGLYLVQGDTANVKGVAFRVAQFPFPKVNQVEELSNCLVYITTSDEAGKLRDAGSDKTRFDKVVLEITREKGRAVELMRNYFRRIELANSYFTSYKEGWKTDRGLIYIIMGLPDVVTRNDQYEVWTYKTLDTKFSFVRAGTIYDPEYYVLDRNARLDEVWYYTIDLWRKSQVGDGVRN